MRPVGLIETKRPSEWERPQWERPAERWFAWLVLCGLGLLLSTGCFQQRYEPANWESASRPASKQQPAPPSANAAGTTLPGKGSAATTLPARNQPNARRNGANSTLPSRGQRSLRDEQRLPAIGSGGNTTLPERPRRGGTTLPSRPESDRLAPSRSTRESNSTLPQREPRQPQRNSGTTLPGRR